MRALSVGLASLMSLGAGAASAQDADDWDLDREPNLNRITASVIYSDGAGVAARCSDGVFEVLLAGLSPATHHETRILTIGIGDEEPVAQSWVRGEVPTVAFSQLPARFARTLRGGGPMRVTSEATDGDPATQITVDIPPSAHAIDEVLTACGKPLEDTRPGASWIVTGVPSPLQWARRPSPEYPREAQRAGMSAGIAALSCDTLPDGRLQNCEIESEYPAGYGFGEESIDATRRARLESPDGFPVPPTIITFSVRYLLSF